MASCITRFAPSPTGLLHVGHAFSAAQAWARADRPGGFRLRIEDIDRTRCRPEFITALLDDLAWLGLEPGAPPLRQSAGHHRHRAALERLRAQGLLYACTCTRAAQAAAAPHPGEGTAYPGTCRGRRDPPPAIPFAWRLDLAGTGLGLWQGWQDEQAGPRAGRADLGGDPVLWRKDDGPAYHLACVIDDAHQGVSLVVRKRDLEPWTALQRLLQRLLGLPEPRYLHHRLILGPDGRRLAKRDRPVTLAALRASGADGRALARQLSELPATGPDLGWDGAAFAPAPTVVPGGAPAGQGA